MYTRHTELSDLATGSTITYYVVSFDPDSYDKLIAQLHPTDFVLALPDHVVVSNRVRVVRSW